MRKLHSGPIHVVRNDTRLSMGFATNIDTLHSLVYLHDGSLKSGSVKASCRRHLEADCKSSKLCLENAEATSSII